jgi:hypothetical protein
MFCPNCKVEYRAGFARCPDCGADLVDVLPVGASAADRNIPRNAEGLELLWSGVSGGLTDRIDEALNDAHIVHKITEKEFGLIPSLSQDSNFVWIESRDRAASRSILGKILTEFGGLERDAELGGPDRARINPFGLGRRVYPREDLSRAAPFETESLFESNKPVEEVPDDIVEDFDPNEATVEVWAGEDRETAENLKPCLTGVGIGCVLRDDGGKIRVFVLPSQENRAREVVREVVDASPPQ